jgi:hypothetical protein
MLPAGSPMLKLEVRAVLTFHTGPCVAPALGYFPQGPGVTAIDRRQPRAQSNITTNRDSAYEFNHLDWPALTFARRVPRDKDAAFEARARSRNIERRTRPATQTQRAPDLVAETR